MHSMKGRRGPVYNILNKNRIALCTFQHLLFGELCGFVVINIAQGCPGTFHLWLAHHFQKVNWDQPLYFAPRERM